MSEFGSSPASAEILFSFDISIRADDLQANWERCNLMANYIAGYAAFQFPEREWAENLISTVANELLESMVHLAPPDSDLRFRCRQYTDRFHIELQHHLRADVAAEYLAFLAEIRTGKSDERYISELRAAERSEPLFNQLGWLMLSHDFHAEIDAAQESVDAPMIIVVRIPTTEIAA